MLLERKESHGKESKRKESQVIGLLPLGKSGKFAKTVIYFFKASGNNDSVAVVCAKQVNQGDGKGMKVPCTLQLTAEEKFIKI